jgi:hypothetical protein
VNHQTETTETKETNEQYHSDVSRLSNSMLSLLKRSPKLFFKYYIEKSLAPPEASDSMAMGSMVHTIVLEPETLDERYRVKPDCDRRTKEGKAVYAEFMASLPNRCEVISPDDFAKATDCATALLAHAELRAVLDATRGESLIEERIDFAVDGVDMRSRLDFLSLAANVIIDIKTTKDASPEEFCKSIANYGYHRQAALYREAVLQKFGSPCRFLLAVVCTEQPFEVALYEPSNEMIAAGMREVWSLLDGFKLRAESGDWTSEWSKGIVPIDLPKWYRG